MRLFYRLSKIIIFVLGITLISLIIVSIYEYNKKIPERIYLSENKESSINLKLPVTGKVTTPCEAYGTAVNFNEEILINTGNCGSYNLDVKLFGLFKLKETKLIVVEDKYLYAGGTPIGIYLKTNGILVVDTTEVVDQNGNPCKPAQNIVKSGDYIMQINHKNIMLKADMLEIIKENKDNEIILTIKRDNYISDVKVKPVLDIENEYKLGIWVKDDTQGIGTLSYIDENGDFGCLGHGINDSDTGKIIEINNGLLFNANIINIIKGQKGIPGEYIGTINYGSDNIIGVVNQNTKNGIYGKLTDEAFEGISSNYNKYMIAHEVDIKKDKAYIINTMDGITHQYEIIIEDINFNSKEPNKMLQFRVTDKELIDKTGGIIQGMSGSPIIQDNKIIGAVTHVFVDDPSRGYGIGIESMLQN